MVFIFWMRLPIDEKERMNMSLDGKTVGWSGISSMTVTSGGGLREDPQHTLGTGIQARREVVPWTGPSASSAKAAHFSGRFLYTWAVSEKEKAGEAVFGLENQEESSHLKKRERDRKNKKLPSAWCFAQKIQDRSLVGIVWSAWWYLTHLFENKEKCQSNIF